MNLSTGITTTVLALTALSPVASAQAAAWNAGPDWSANLPADGGRVNLPDGITELDAWLLNAAGQAVVRLRQRPTRRCFTRPRRTRCLVTYSTRSVATGYDTTAFGARVFGWRS